MENYDLAIIGGGINGVAIARDAALRGMSVILLEKGDFGNGASTKTSKLIHGGLRYLAYLEYKLVRESLRERSVLLKKAPRLVKPLPFVIPVYENDPKALWQIKLGLYVYDFLNKSPELPKHVPLSSADILKLFPNLKQDGLKGGCLFFDAQMKDNRLLMENLASAEELGVNCLNYAKVTGLVKENNALTGIRFINPETHREGIIRAKVIVNSTGAWSNQILDQDNPQDFYRAEPTKGVHLIIDQISACHALLLRAPQDGRIFFLMPWEGYSLLGTTDTFYMDNPDRVSVSSNDSTYLIQALDHYFPNENHSIISSFAGLRPLVKSDQKNPNAISRSHVVHVSPSGLISVLGGKYTTYRKLAEDVVDLAALRLNNKTHCKTRDIGLKSTQYVPAVGVTAKQAAHILSNYSYGYSALLQILHEHPEEKEQICSQHPHLMGEITYAIQHEKAKKLEDWFYRRTSIAYSACGGSDCVTQVAQKFAVLLNWDTSRCREEIQEYLKNVIRGH